MWTAPWLVLKSHPQLAAAASIPLSIPSMFYCPSPPALIQFHRSPSDLNCTHPCISSTAATSDEAEWTLLRLGQASGCILPTVHRRGLNPSKFGRAQLAPLSEPLSPCSHIGHPTSEWNPQGPLASSLVAFPSVERKICHFWRPSASGYQLLPPAPSTTHKVERERKKKPLANLQLPHAQSRVRDFLRVQYPPPLMRTPTIPIRSR